jgi:hypothetical protein
MSRLPLIAARTVLGITLIAGMGLLVHRVIPVGASASVAMQRCSNIQLSVRRVAGSGAAGTVVVVYRLHVLWGGPCSLQGFPGVELLDKQFHSLPTQVQRGDGVSIIASVPVRQVVLDGQHDAYFALEYHHVPINNHPCYSPRYLMVIPPNDRLPIVTYSGIDYSCGTISVSPVTSRSPLR